MAKVATKYATLLTKTQESKDKEELSFKVEESEQQLSTDILNTKRLLSKAKRELLSAKGAFPFSAKTILDAEDNVSDIETSIERLEGLKGMF